MSSFDDRFHAPPRLLNKTAKCGFSYHLTPQHQSNQDSGSSGYNSLPRLRTGNKGGPSNLSQARRKLVNSALQDYLKSLNAMTRSIVLETESVEKEHCCDWTKMDEAKKEDIVNEHFVPSGVRLQYEDERASSCCSFSSARSLGQSSLHQDELVMESRPSHSSQPSSDWEEPTSKGILFTNKWSTTASDQEDIPVEDFQPSNFDRLHKKQLSFRPSHKHVVKQRHSPPQKRILPSHQLGSDGESQRTSDEDYESNPLGFQRSKLRSFSMRSRRAGGSVKNSANLRSSVRTTHKIRTSPDGEESKKPESFIQQCRPSHYHTYSTTSTDTDFDEEIDMPDDALLLDHVPRKISADETDSSASYQPSSATTDHYRTRRPFRAAPKIALDSSEVIQNTSSLCEAEESTDLSTTEDSSSTFLAESQDTSSNFFRSQSRESLDMDSVSMAPSDLSKYDDESMLDHSRMTPESLLSVSTYSSRCRSKSSEMAVLRNRKGKRGGSHFRVATSEFADRHTQFKNNMLQRHHLDSSCQSSAVTTRANSPASSIASSIPPNHLHSQDDATNHLQTPPNFIFSANHSKHSSMAESTTSDLPRSPSIFSSPPTTPLAVSYTPHSQILRKGLSSRCEEHRESGYVSSSSESFPVAARR